MESATTLIKETENLLFKDFNPFVGPKKSKIFANITKLESELSFVSKTIRITQTQKNLIVQAIGLSQGHWYECPNGHAYVIDACGGAMEEAKCPDCGAKIGELAVDYIMMLNLS